MPKRSYTGTAKQAEDGSRWHLPEHEAAEKSYFIDYQQDAGRVARRSYG